MQHVANTPSVDTLPHILMPQSPHLAILSVSCACGKGKRTARETHTKNRVLKSQNAVELTSSCSSGPCLEPFPFRPSRLIQMDMSVTHCSHKRKDSRSQCYHILLVKFECLLYHNTSYPKRPQSHTLKKDVSYQMRLSVEIGTVLTTVVTIRFIPVCLPRFIPISGNGSLQFLIFRKRFSTIWRQNESRRSARRCWCPRAKLWEDRHWLVH